MSFDTRKGSAAAWMKSSLAFACPNNGPSTTSGDIGLSRSALADRFTRLIGEPPMRYLARWRLQLAAHYLRSSDMPLARIAEQVGYESGAAFNRAF